MEPHRFAKLMPLRLAQTMTVLWLPNKIRQAIIFCSCSFFLHSSFFLSFFLAYSQRSEIGCLQYFHTWCGLSANLECRYEMCWCGSLKIQDATITPIIAICAPSHKFVRLYLCN